MYWEKQALYHSGYAECGAKCISLVVTPFCIRTANTLCGKKKTRQVCLNFWHMHTSYELLSCLMDPRMVGICRAFSVATGSRLQHIYHDCIWEKRLIWETLQNRCWSPGRWQVLTSGCKVLNTLWPAQLCVRLWLFSQVKVFVHKDTQLLWNSCIVSFFSACYWACSPIAASLTLLSSTILFCYGFSSAASALHSNLYLLW